MKIYTKYKLKDNETKMLIFSSQEMRALTFKATGIMDSVWTHIIIPKLFNYHNKIISFINNLNQTSQNGTRGWE